MHLSREMRRFEMDDLSSRRGDRKRSPNRERIVQFYLKSLFILIAVFAVGLAAYLFAESHRPTKPEFNYFNTLLDIGLMGVASACVIIAFANILARSGATHAAERRYRRIWVALAFIVPWVVGLNMTVGVNFGPPQPNNAVLPGRENRLHLWQDYMAVRDVGLEGTIFAEAIWHGLLVVTMGTGTLFCYSRIRRFRCSVDGEPSNEPEHASRANQNGQ